MPSPFHHGFRLHRLRNCHDHPASSRTSVAPSHRALPGILRLHRHRRLGLRQHLHRTPLGPSLGQERSSTHLHGYRVVVRRPPRNMAITLSLRPTTPQHPSRHRDHPHRLGDVRTPARPSLVNNGSLSLRLDPHGSRRCTDRRNLLPAQRLPWQH